MLKYFLQSLDHFAPTKSLMSHCMHLGIQGIFSFFKQWFKRMVYWLINDCPLYKLVCLTAWLRTREEAGCMQNDYNVKLQLSGLSDFCILQCSLWGAICHVLPCLFLLYEMHHFFQFNGWSLWCAKTWNCDQICISLQTHYELDIKEEKINVKSYWT